MKKYIFLIFGCIMLMAITTSCGSKSKTDNATENTDNTAINSAKPAKKEFIELAKKANAHMPQHIPGNIRIDKVEAVSEDEYKYYYTFTKPPVVSADEFIKTSRLAFQIGLSEGKGEDLELFRKHRMTVIYAYYNMDKSLFAEIRITPQEYIK